MKTMTYGFVGAGNMARALIQGLLKNGVEPKHIVACCPHEDHLVTYQSWGIQTSTDNTLACRQSVVILAVKPSQMKPVCESLAMILAQHNPVLISIAAGILVSQIHRWLNYEAQLIRMMPNTPALCGAGTTGIYTPSTVSDSIKQLAFDFASFFGFATFVQEESELHLLTAVSGSGPAYFLYLSEAIIEGAVQLGMSESTAQALVKHTLHGSAQLLFNTGKSPQQLRKEISSPNGVTERAISILEQADFKKTLLTLLKAASARSEELSTQWDK